MFSFLPSLGQSAVKLFGDTCSPSSFPHCVAFLMPLPFFFLFSKLSCAVENLIALLIGTCFQSGCKGIPSKSWSLHPNFSIQKFCRLDFLNHVPSSPPWERMPDYSLALFQVCQQPVNFQFTKGRIILGKHGRWKKANIGLGSCSLSSVWPLLC